MTISLRPQGPFFLLAPLSVALTDDGGEPVAFRAVWTGEAVDVDFVSDLPPTRVEAHAARVLSLDVDARDLPSLADRDPVLARLLGEAGLGDRSASARRSRRPCGRSCPSASRWHRRGG